MEQGPVVMFPPSLLPSLLPPYIAEILNTHAAGKDCRETIDAANRLARSDQYQDHLAIWQNAFRGQCSACSDEAFSPRPVCWQDCPVRE